MRPRWSTRAAASAPSCTTGALLAGPATAAGGRRRQPRLVLENGRLEVELRARVEALRASRARIVEAGDEERRRLGRDLHDGAQQRLVTLLIELRMARDRWDDKPEGVPLDGRAVAHRERRPQPCKELRELAAGIDPAILSQRGLRRRDRHARLALGLCPWETDVKIYERPPFTFETAAYFVVAEALTNVAKYADATHARVVVPASLRRQP